MGALPSRETHQRGLYSHRHGRNRRSEIILIPLTTTFFPSVDCPLFQHLFQARHQRTPKYYYRSLRSADAPPESDYFCTTSAVSSPDTFAEFNAERLGRAREAAAVQSGSPLTMGTSGEGASADAAYHFENYADTPEGLYQVLITDNDHGVYETDEALRQAYLRQVREQREEWGSASRHFAPPCSRCCCSSSSPRPPYGCSCACGAAAPPPVMENVAFDAFVSGYTAAKRYVRGKQLHTSYQAASPGGQRGAKSTARKHVTSPAAYYLRPIPCAIASRHDRHKPAPVDDPMYVDFQGTHVKVLGMFGAFPATVPMRHKTRAGAGGATCSLSKEGQTNSDDNVDSDTEVEQHLLKGTMFIDKDVGDQILGNVLMLATYMYVRQCVEARIEPRYIPMLPVLMRTPLSNVPMLQFIREFRVRTRSLLVAGTAKSGEKPFYAGMSGFNAEDIVGTHNAAQTRAEEEAYLFEKDIPDATTYQELFHDYSAGGGGGGSGGSNSGATAFAPLCNHIGNNTHPGGPIPILMMSGFNVQSTPLRHPALNSTTSAAAPHVGQNSLRIQLSHSTPSSPNSQSLSFPIPGHPPPPPHAAAAAVSAAAQLPPPPIFAVPAFTPQAEARKVALLTRRKQRFRMWVEDGHLCVWISAAYARRGCLLLAQQLNTTVDSNSVPEHRGWKYRGVLHPGMQVPTPTYMNDVLVVGEDVAALGLWQGDLLRCCTSEELAARRLGLPLPLPCQLTASSSSGGAGGTSPAVTPSSTASKKKREGKGGAAGSEMEAPGSSAAEAAEPISGHVNYTSNHVSNPLLRAGLEAPIGSFWVRGSGGLDDSLINITESNLPHSPKMEKQKQQQQQQPPPPPPPLQLQSVRRPASPTASPTANGKASGAATTAVTGSDRKLFLDPDRREGTLNLEEVILSWIKVISIVSREATVEDPEWVRDPSGSPLCVDRYLIRRIEHDGIRYFVGVTPRFMGQTRRIERMLGEVYALEDEEGERGDAGGGGTERTISAEPGHRIPPSIGSDTGTGRRVLSLDGFSPSSLDETMATPFAAFVGGMDTRISAAPDLEEDELRDDLLEHFGRDHILFTDEH